jgi:hypothetical protein
MRAAGVNVAIGMINDDEARQVRSSGNMPAISSHRARARRTGLSWGEALARSPRGRPKRSAWAARSARSRRAAAPTS